MKNHRKTPIPAVKSVEPASVGNTGQRQINDQRPEALRQQSLQRAIKGSKVQSQQQEKINTLQRKPNKTGLPDQLKSGIENLSGISMDQVKVHYGSSLPTQLNALAYAQGSDIHVAPGQEKHLPHEAWHIVQQQQGRVKPTLQSGGVPINDDPGLEKEADIMGGRALQMKEVKRTKVVDESLIPLADSEVAQLLLVKVKTQKTKDGRVITSVEIAERAPTTVSGSQGDHTVAEALLELTLVNFIVGKTHQQVAASILQLLYHLDEQAKAKFLGESNKYINLDIEYIQLLIKQYYEMANNKDTEGEDLNTKLEEILDTFIRLWNKRAGSAYKRSEGKTTGGGDGVGEKEAKKKIKEIGEQSKIEGASEELVFDISNYVLNMVDFKISGNEDLEEAARHLTTAIELVLQAYPDLETNYYDLMVFVVETFCKKAGLNKKQGEILFELVHSKVTPYDNEDYMEFVEEDVIIKKKPKKITKESLEEDKKTKRVSLFIKDWNGRSLPDEVFRYFILTGNNVFLINGSMTITITKYNNKTGDISYTIGYLGG